MKTIKGPSVHLAQFSGARAPFDALATIADWANELGFKALQIPAWDQRLFDVAKAAESQAYCDDITGIFTERGLVVSELTAHLFGQLVAVHPAYDAMCDAFAPAALHGNPAARSEWAIERIKLTAKASRRLRLNAMGTFSGSFLWPYFFPFPQRPEGLVEAAFDELARRWLPILNTCDDEGVDLCFEL
ncbi:MAG: AP endonuclease, partial [Methylocystaceae bacterium]